MKCFKITSFLLIFFLGLDEAIFDTDDLIVRLDKSDASFVDIIRTTEADAQNIEFPYDVGHVTFVPNLAGSQPGCSDLNWSKFCHCNNVNFHYSFVL